MLQRTVISSQTMVRWRCFKNFVGCIVKDTKQAENLRVKQERNRRRDNTEQIGYKQQQFDKDPLSKIIIVGLSAYH